MNGESFRGERAPAADGKVTVYRPRGKLSGQKECFAWLEDVRRDIHEGHTHLVLNCRDLERVDSTGIGIIASIHVSCTKAGGALYLTGLSSTTRVLFETTWLLKVMKNVDGEEEAIRACAAEA